MIYDSEEMKALNRLHNNCNPKTDYFQSGGYIEDWRRVKHALEEREHCIIQNGKLLEENKNLQQKICSLNEFNIGLHLANFHLMPSREEQALKILSREKETILDIMGWTTNKEEYDLLKEVLL